MRGEGDGGMGLVEIGSQLYDTGLRARVKRTRERLGMKPARAGGETGEGSAGIGTGSNQENA